MAVDARSLPGRSVIGYATLASTHTASLFVLHAIDSFIQYNSFYISGCID